MANVEEAGIKKAGVEEVGIEKAHFYVRIGIFSYTIVFLYKRKN